MTASTYTDERRAAVRELLTPIVGDLSAAIISCYRPVKFTKRCRETGATILVSIAEGDANDDAEYRWHTFCLTHGGEIQHANRRDAISWAAQPSAWCHGCGANTGDYEPEAGE